MSENLSPELPLVTFDISVATLFSDYVSWLDRVVLQHARFSTLFHWPQCDVWDQLAWHMSQINSETNASKCKTKI
jgi:hypothetical protein